MRYVIQTRYGDGDQWSSTMGCASGRTYSTRGDGEEQYAYALKWAAVRLDGLHVRLLEYATYADGTLSDSFRTLATTEGR